MLEETQWQRLQRLLPKQKAGPEAIRGDRLFIEAVLFQAKTGLQWRDLPERFGPWKSVYNRFSNWAKKGHWAAIFRELQLDVDETGCIVDGSDPIPPETPEESTERYDRARVSRNASGTIELCCFRRRGPNFSENPIALWRSIWWPVSVPLGTGDALHAPFEYGNRRTTIPLEMVTPWSNVISVKSTQSFNRPVGVTSTVFGAFIGAMGAAVIVPETKSDTPHIYSASMIGIGSVLVVAGLVMLVTPSRETEWRSEAR